MLALSISSRPARKITKPPWMTRLAPKYEWLVLRGTDMGIISFGGTA